ncbi:hypothetical protein EauS123_00018 [Exiguobacterium phage vB_EauS-123]|nr:hypothetical protein EauS123_00018 [Exiguobacterium phage vB_EauS-123]
MTGLGALTAVSLFGIAIVTMLVLIVFAYDHMEEMNK